MAGVVLSGLRIGFTRAGQGPPVVLLGGFVGSGDTTWRHQIEALSRSHNRARLGRSGTGRVAGRADVLPVAGLRRPPGRAAVLVGLEPAVLVGLSFGGAVALELFRRHRGQVRALFLVGVSPGWSGSLPAEVVQTRWGPASRHPTDPRGVRVGPAAQHVLGPGRPGPGRRVRRQHGGELPPRRIPHPGPGLGRGGPARPAALGRRPHGGPARRGRCSDTAHRGRRRARGDSRPRLVVLPGVGHVSPVEAPERVTAEVQAFLGR